jgi:hypothetical protein
LFDIQNQIKGLEDTSENRDLIEAEKRKLSGLVSNHWMANKNVESIWRQKSR